MSFKAQFIALWVVWLFWELLLAARYGVGKAPAAAEREPPEESKPVELRLKEGVQRSQRMVRDSLLALLLVLLINFVASSGANGITTLSWIYVGIVVAWIVYEMYFDKAHRVWFWVARWALALAILVVAFASGWP